MWINNYSYICGTRSLTVIKLIIIYHMAYQMTWSDTYLFPRSDGVVMFGVHYRLEPLQSKSG